MHKILVIGGGFAGLWAALGAARQLDDAGRSGDVAITLVAGDDHLTNRPRLYEGGLRAAEVRWPLRPLLEPAGIEYRQAMAERIDWERQAVAGRTPDGSPTEFRYDRLVLASGSALRRPPLPGAGDHGWCIDTFEQAMALEAHLQALGAAPPAAGRDTVVVVGAGFTGIEAACEMAGRIAGLPGRRVVLIEQAPDVGPDLGPGPRPVIAEALAALGVEVSTGAGLAAVDAAGVVLADGRRIEAATVLWTTGVVASPLAAALPGPHDAQGRLLVDQYLRLPGAPAVLAAGDVASAPIGPERSLMSCQHAITLGLAAGHNAAREIIGLPPLPYSPPDYVTCLDLGPWGAVFTTGWHRAVKIAGGEAKSLKRAINTEWIRPPRDADRQSLLEAASLARRRPSRAGA